MDTTLRWTSSDLEVLHNDSKRYEIIDGDLYVSRQPGYHHQYACTQLSGALVVWSNQTSLGVTLQRKVEGYRRQQMALHLLATLYTTDTLTSPLLPGFACLVVLSLTTSSRSRGHRRRGNAVHTGDDELGTT